MRIKLLLLAFGAWLTLPQGAHSVAIATRNSISLKGSLITFDSYDSADPSHSTPMGTYDPATRKAGGDLASAEGVINVGNASVNGHLRTGTNGNYSIGPNGFAGDLSWAGPGVQPGWFARDFDQDFPEAQVPFVFGLPPPAGSGSIKFLLGSTDYTLDGDLLLNNGEVLYVAGNSRLYVPGDVNMSSSGMIWLGDGASLQLYVGGSTTRLTTVTTPGPPRLFQYFGLQTNTDFGWQSTDRVGTIYAPQADCTLGSGSFLGAAVFRSLVVNSSLQFHYDENLLRHGHATPAARLVLSSVGDQLQIRVAGVVGGSYALQTSSNLLDWAPMVTNQSPFDVLQDTLAPARFYRALFIP